MNRIIITIIALCCVYISFGQQSIPPYQVSETKAIYLGKTRAVRDLPSPLEEHKSKKAKFKEARKKPANFKSRRGFSKVIRPDLEHQGIDSIRQTEDGAVLIAPKVNILGEDFGGSPSDPSGDIGKDYYIQMINGTRIAIYSKFGGQVQVFDAERLWESIGATSEGDPIVLYDERAERWFLTEFTAPANLLIAVSVTSDPFGEYHTYTFATPEFPDYPKYGLWPEALVVTSNEGGSGVLHQYFIDRLALLRGDEQVTMQRVEVVGNLNTEAGFFITTPIDIDGKQDPSNKNPITMVLNDASWGAVDQDQLELYEFVIDWDNADSTKVINKSLVTQPYDGFPCAASDGFSFACIPQAGGLGLDGIPEVIMNVPKYRNFGTHESIVLSFTTDVTNGDDLAGIRWMELRKTAETDWTIYQEGTYAPDDNLNRFMPSIAIDSLGNIGLAYNTSSSRSFADVRFTGRYADDSLGVMTVKEFVLAEGVTTIFSGGRFGDYSQMSVDPVDNTTFWFTGEYAGGGETGVKTRIAAFELDKAELDVAIASLQAPPLDSLTDNESLTFLIGNTGLSPLSNYQIGIRVNGELIEERTIPETLPVDSLRAHTFEGLDFLKKGAYEVEVFTSHPEDLKVGNNQARTIVRSLFNYDIGIAASSSATACSAEGNPLAIEFENKGNQLLEEIVFELFVNEQSTGTRVWEGQLPNGESATFDTEFALETQGTSQIAVKVVGLNGNPDAVAEDNLSALEVNYDDQFETVTFRLQSDFFPEETSWSLLDSKGVEIAIGGSYDPELGGSVIVESFCLDPQECYTFIIRDAFGDGICCGDYGDGNYEILDEEGIVMVASDGQFGASELRVFCPSKFCNVNATVNISDSDGTDNGTIIVEASGSADNDYQYSIDGGATFQSSNTFEGLAPDDYKVVVIIGENQDCAYEEEVTINVITSIGKIVEADLSVLISPNPNDGFFNVQIESDQIQTPMLHIELIDAQGRILQNRKIGKYNGTFVGQISLVTQPKGLYYLRLIDQEKSKLYKVVVK
ncbi:MAG: T9SS type A sorting domain-containing protein [Bacteroidota bacterium]